MSSELRYDIVETSLEAYTRELVARLYDGWYVHESNRGYVIGPYGGVYTATMYRDASTVAKLKARSAEVVDAPKPDRASQLAAARAAKAAKKAERQESEE